MIFLTQKGDHRRVALLAGQSHRGIARQQLLQSENQQRHKEQGRQDERQPAQQEGRHRPNGRELELETISFTTRVRTTPACLPLMNFPRLSEPARHAASIGVPSKRALVAIFSSKVRKAAPTRCAIAMLSTSAVRRLRSSRRRNASAADTSAAFVCSRLGARAAHASKAENPDRASSGVISPVRTRRAMAEANSAAAKSLTTSTGFLVRIKVSARPVSRSSVSSATRTLASRYTSPLLLIPQLGQQQTGVFRGLSSADPTLREPVQVGWRHRTRRLGDGFERDHGTSVAGDHHVLAVEGPVDQFRELVLGFSNAVSAHRLNIAMI